MKGTELDLRTRASDAWRSRPATAAVVAFAVLGGALAALELLHPLYSISGGGRAAIETAIIAAAVLSGRFLTETFERSRHLRDLLLLLGVCSLAIGGLSYWLGPVVAGVPAGTSGAGARLACELLGALALAGAALTPPRVILRPVRGRARVAAALGIGGALAAAVLAEALTAHASSASTSAVSAPWSVHTVAVGVDLFATATMAVAGLALVARSWGQRGTELMAAGFLLLAAGSAQFAAVPHVPADVVMVGDAARALAFALLLGGAYLRFAAAQRRDADTAIRTERERVARDLHDGLAQDLVCITTEAQRLDCRLSADDPLMLATRDALTELRAMIADLTASAASTSEEAVQLLAHDLGRRLDLQVTVRTEPGDRPAEERSLELESREDLLRATQEAIVTAAGHGEDGSVDVAVSRRRGRVVVRVSPGAEDEPKPPVRVAAGSQRARRTPRLSVDWSRRVARRRPV